MEIKIPKEIRQYEEGFFLGLSLRQCLFGALAIAVAVAVFVLLQPMLGLETVSWVCVLAAAPFAFAGFFRYHGMTFEQFAAAWFRTTFLYSKRLILRPTNLYWDSLAPGIEKGRRKGRKYRTPRNQKSRKQEVPHD